MTSEEMSTYLHNPNLVQSKILELINTNKEIVDPSNPFMFLLESNALVANGLAELFAKTMRNMYPKLASSSDEIYHHLSNNELEDVFASPSTGYFTLFINVRDIINYGYKTTLYREIIIPKFTTITVNETVFTFLNDVSIRYYNSRKTFVRIIGNSDSLSVDADEICPSGIVTDTNLQEWIAFSIELLQINISTVTDTLLDSKSYTKEIELTDQYCYSEVYSIITSTDLLTAVNKSYSNFVYDPNNPTVYIRYSDDRIIYELPAIYTINQMVKTKIIMDTYMTKGAVELPLHKYTASDFVLSYKISDTKDSSVLAVQNVNIYCKSTSFTSGGRDVISFSELKNKIINYATGDNLIPITEEEISEEVSQQGFILLKDMDSILERRFTIYKEFDYSEDNSVRALPDLFMSTIPIDGTMVDDNYIIKNNNSLIINPFSVFKLNDAGNLSPMTLSEITSTFYGSTDIVNIDNNKYFYTLYKSIIDYDESLTMRAFDLNLPKIENNRNANFATSLTGSMSISSYSTTRIKDSYRIDIIIEATDTFLALDLTRLKLQIAIKVPNTDNYVYYYGSISVTGDGIVGSITVGTTGYIDNTNNIYLLNYDSSLTNVYTPLNSEFIFVLYSTDEELETTESVLNTLINDPDGTCGIYKEVFDFEFGIYLEYLYNNCRVEYTERKYLKYEEDVYLRYTEDVYEQDGSGLAMTFVDTDSDGEVDNVEFNLLHSAGDIVYLDGEPVIQHYAGDIILDEVGLPTIDTTYGVNYYFNLLLLEIEFYLVNNEEYNNYQTSLYQGITDMLINSITAINERMLENTIVEYRCRNNLNDVKLITNEITYTSSNFVKPKISIYINDADYTSDFLENATPIVNIELQRGLRNHLNISVIEENIKTLINENILSIKITGLDSINDLNIKNYASDSSDIIIGKTIEKTSDGSYIVGLNTNIEIVRI